MILSVRMLNFIKLSGNNIPIFDLFKNSVHTNKNYVMTQSMVTGPV